MMEKMMDMERRVCFKRVLIFQIGICKYQTDGLSVSCALALSWRILTNSPIWLLRIFNYALTQV